MKYAVIGTSWITEKFVSAANTLNGAELNAVYSRTKEKADAFAEKFGVGKRYTDLSDIAGDSEIDSVYIASPNVFHYSQSRFFLKHGKNVICEKPATTSKAEMEELFFLAEKNNLIYAEAIMSIHTDGFGILKAQLKKARRIRTVHLDFCQLSSKYQAYNDGKNPNIFNPEMHTGCLMDIGVYNIYISAALYGMPKKILSSADFLSSGADSNGSAIMVYPDFTVTLNYSKTGQGYSASEFIGDAGTVSVDSVSQLTGIDFITKDGRRNIHSYDISRDIIMSGEMAFFKTLTETKDFSSPDYIFAKDTALKVREICDIIRKDNSFTF